MWVRGGGKYRGVEFTDGLRDRTASTGRGPEHCVRLARTRKRGDKPDQVMTQPGRQAICIGCVHALRCPSAISGGTSVNSTTSNSFFWTKASPALLSILRIITAFLFIPHGAEKLFGWLGGTQVHLMSLMGLAGVLEFFGGLLVLIGLATRPVAFILAGEMAFAYFLAHSPANFWPILNGGSMAIMFCFTFLYLSAAGAGPWSVDRLLHRR